MRRWHALPLLGLLGLLGLLTWPGAPPAPRRLGSPGCKIVQLRAEPKSGTTWVEFILEALADEYAEAHGVHVTQREARKYTVTAPGVDVSLQPYAGDGLRFGKHGLTDFGIKRDHIKDSCCVPRTLPPKLDEAKIASRWERKVKSGQCLIFLLRDPRDVVVSGCWFRGGEKCVPDAWMKKEIEVTSAWTAFRKRLYDLLAGSHPDHVHLVLFEQLKDDPEREVARLASFVGLPLTDEQVRTVVEATTVDVMHHAEQENELPGRNRPNSLKVKVRKGNVCGFEDEVSPSVAADATRVVEEILPPELVAEWDCR